MTPEHKRELRRVLSFLDGLGPMTAADLLAVHVPKQRPTACDLAIWLQELIDAGDVRAKDAVYHYVQDTVGFSRARPVAICNHVWQHFETTLGPGKYKTRTACSLCGQSRTDYD